MPYNGSGSFSAPSASFPAASGALIESAKFNNIVNDIASGLSSAITKDGQTTVTANLPMAGFRHTGVGNAVARTDYAAAGQVQDNSLRWAGTATGTANAITLTLTPPITAYATGQSFDYVSSASANTGAMTVNINGAGAKAIQINGAACSSGDHPAGKLMRITYDGTAFQLERIGSAVHVYGSQTIAGAKTFSGAVTCSSTLAVGGAMSVTGALTPSQTAGIVGTTTNNDANAGSVGEYVSSTVASGSAVALTTATAKTVTSISLTAGDWDVNGQVLASGTATTQVSTIFGGSSLTANTVDSTKAFLYVAQPFTPGAAFEAGFAIPTVRFSLSATTTVYLTARATFGTSTLAAYGFISARRFR